MPFYSIFIIQTPNYTTPVPPFYHILSSLFSLHWDDHYSAVQWPTGNQASRPQRSPIDHGRSSQHSTSSAPASFAFSSLTVASPLYFFSVRSLLAASNSDNLFWSWWIFRWWRASSSFFCCSCCCWYWTCAYYRMVCQRRKNRKLNRERSEEKQPFLHHFQISLLRKSLFQLQISWKSK